MPILLPFIIAWVLGVGPVLVLFLALPKPLGSLSRLALRLCIGAGSGLDPGWGQVVRLVACFCQPLLIVGHIQPIPILHLMGPGGLRHQGTVAPPGVHRPCLETKIPLRTNGNQGRWRRVMGAWSKRLGSPIQSQGPWSPDREIYGAGAHRVGSSSRTPGSCLRSTGTHGVRRCSGRLTVVLDRPNEKPLEVDQKSQTSEKQNRQTSTTT